MRRALAAVLALTFVAGGFGDGAHAAAGTAPTIVSRLTDASRHEITGGEIASGAPLIVEATVGGSGGPPTGAIAVDRYDTGDCSGVPGGGDLAPLVTESLPTAHAADLSNAAGWDSATTWNSNGQDYIAADWAGSLFAGNDLAFFASSSMAWRFNAVPLSPGETVDRAYLSLRIRQSRPSIQSEPPATWTALIRADPYSGADFAGLSPADFQRRFASAGVLWELPFSSTVVDPFGTGDGATYASSPDIAALVNARIGDPAWAAGGSVVVGVLNNRTIGIAEAQVIALPDYARLHIEWTTYTQVQQAEYATVAAAPGVYSYRVRYTGDAVYAAAAGPCMPVTVTPADADADGYPDSEEIALGKDPRVYCAVMRADVNGDGAVNILDLAGAASRYSEAVPPAPARYDQGPPSFDNIINILDLAKMAGVYGQSVAACP
ncbi:MAG: hypothetical protein ACYC9X_08720 [Dehalococcoidia bacterium]